MKRLLGLLGVGLISLLVVPLALAQQAAPTSAGTSVPRLIRFSGALRDHNGHPISGTVGVTFSLYKDQEGGVALWMETQNLPADASGHYNVLLGASKPNGLPMELFASGEARWLGVQAEGQAEQPRVLLVSAPYALKAADAETVGGLPPSAFMLATPASLGASGASSMTAAAASSAATVGGLGTANFLPIWSNGTTLGNSVLFQSGTGATAKVGINTITPSAALDVHGGGVIRGLLNLPATGASTAAAGKNSQALNLTASSFKSGTGGGAVNQNFRWQAEPSSNNTATPSGTLNLLFGAGTAAPAETGMKIANNGIITFAPGQTLPTVTGNESVTGNLSASGDLGIGTTTPLANVDILGAQHTLIGNMGCVGAFGGIGFGANSNVGCTNYSLLGEGINTILNRPQGGGIFFREANNTQMTIASGGNVGIGITSPGARLHVDQVPGANGSDVLALTSGGSAAVASLLLQNTATGGLRLRHGVGTGMAYVASSGHLAFIAHDTGTPSFPSSPQMLITAAGNIGIGTSAPAYPVTIVSSSYQPLFVQSSSTFGTWLQLNNTSAGGHNWAILSSGGANSEGAGNLGITNFTGTSTIFLEGNVNANSLHSSGPASFASTDAGTLLHVGGTTSPTTTAQGAYLGWNSLTGGTGQTDFINNQGGGSGGFAFINTPSSGTPKSTLMVITGGGDVGINNPSPAATLDVGGNAKIGGSVQINGDTPMSSNPRMTFSGFFAGAMSSQHVGGVFLPDRAITLTRATMTLDTQASGCSVAPALIISSCTGGTCPIVVDLPTPMNFWFADSGPISVAVPAGNELQIASSAGAGCSTFPANASVIVQYKMQ